MQYELVFFLFLVNSSINIREITSTSNLVNYYINTPYKNAANKAPVMGATTGIQL